MPVTTRPSAPPRDSSLDLPLIDAAAAGNLPRVRRLLVSGASVRATDDQGRTPLVAAAYGNKVAVARVLVRNGADPNEKDASVQSAYLISTSEVGDDPRLLGLLLRNGADVSSRDSFNGTGLIRAAERGFPDVIETLLATEIEIDHVNRLGWTALHEAIILGNGGREHTAVVALLVEAGADVNLPSVSDGVRPLTHARQRGYRGIARILEEAGARP
jgi:ankyrin repeat protein